MNKAYYVIDKDDLRFIDVSVTDTIDINIKFKVGSLNMSLDKDLAQELSTKLEQAIMDNDLKGDI